MPNGRIADQFDPYDPAQRTNPYPFYELARRDEPVFFAPAFGFWVVTRYADALAVLRDPVLFSSQGAMRGPANPVPPQVEAILATGYPEMPLAILTDPPDHSSRRQAVASGLPADRIERLRPRMELTANELIDGFIETGAADIIERFASPFPLLVLGDFLGIDRANLADLRAWIDDWIALFRPSGSVEEMLARARRVVALQRYFEHAFQERLGSPKDDALSALLAPDVAMAERIGIPISFFLGGHLTISRTIGSALRVLASDPAQLNRIAADERLLALAIEEVLRLEAPTQAVFRVATREVRFGEVTIPAGERLFVHLGSANRDERLFPDAAVFCPERTGLTRHLAFGRGAHFCSGTALARTTLAIGLGILLERLPGLRLDPEGTAEYDPQFQSRGYSRLDIVWDRPQRSDGECHQEAGS